MKDRFSALSANKWSSKLMHRTEAIFDGVVAIAMTMIALEISLPDTEQFDLSALALLGQEVTTYFISFIVLASVWTIHAWIYAAYEQLGRPLDIFVNVILLFFITLFPILVKLQSTASGGLLNWIYLGCYIIMELLLLILIAGTSTSTNQQRVELLQEMPNLLELTQNQAGAQGGDAVKERLALLEKCTSDSAAVQQYYQEMLAKLPPAIQKQIELKEYKQRLRRKTLILFYVVSFFAVTASVLSMMFNPYWSYGILLLAMLVFALGSAWLHKKQ